MAKIAIMGFGTVGSGVLEVCRRNAASIARRAGEPVEVKYILDVRDFSASPDAALFTNSIDTILNDPETRHHFTEEVCDVLMYLNDVLLCYGITPNEVENVYLEKHKRNMSRW